MTQERNLPERHSALVALVRELAVVGRDVAGQPRVKMVNMNTMEEPWEPSKPENG